MQRQKLVRWIGLAFIMTLVTGLASFIPAMAQAPAVFINEIQVSTSSTDWEFFELQGAAGTDLSSLTLIGVESDAGPSAGTIDREISLLGQTIPSDGFFLGINTTGAATYGVTGDIDIPENAFENGTATYFLVADFTGAAGDDLDTNDDGVLDVTPWSEIVDSINIRDSASDFDYAAASVVGPDGTFLPSGTYRCPDAPAGTFGSNILNFSTPNGTPGTSNILTCGLPDVWINEIHYDNASTDTGEAVEVAGPAGTDLTGWSLVLYNGNGGAPYNTVALSGILPDQDNGFGTAFESISGIQNGAPDGLALVYGGTAVQFLSYEGSFTAVGGPADGMTSTDIGVAEAGSSAIGDSLQLVGTGLTYADFSWAGSSPNTFGAVNTGQAFGTPVVTGQPLPLDEGFDDCTLAGWEIISVDTDTSNTWGCNSFFSNIDANGFSDSAPANEWLITPPLNMDAQVDDILTFRSYTRFTDINYPQVHVLYSMDYDGGGDPTTATWTELTGINFSPEGSSTWVDSGKVDLSGISGDTVYFAFQYVSSGTGGGSAANWRLDAISFEEDPEKKIHQVQGSGAESPHVGKTVIIEGIVVGDFQDNDGDTNDLNGFFVQEEDFDTDANPLTSEGIFVYDGSSPAVDVAVGDLVSVTGSVSEFDGLTEITSFSGVEVVSSGNPLPAASILSLPVGSVEDFEAYEGMLVTFPQSLYISEFFNFDRFGEIVLTSERQFQPTATYEPGSDAAKQLREDNKLGRITLDDGRTASNPDPAIHPNGAVFNLDNLFRGGDIVNDVTGVISYGFGLYRIQPTAGAAFTSMNPRTDMPDDVGGNLKVAAFNVLNYFTTLDDGSNDICGPLADQECRGADSAEEFERQRDKIIAAIAAIDADVVGLIEIENHPGDVPVADLVSGLNDEMGAGTYEYVATGALGSDAIRQAFIYKPATVSLVGDYAALDTPEFLDPLDYGDDKNRPALAQTFIDNETGGIFTAVVNHLKSKGTPCGPEDDDEMAASCNLTRTLAAVELLDWLGTDPTGSGDGDFLIMGDLNSYDKEDPIDALVGGGYTDLLYQLLGENAYSYVFDGQLGYLDYAMVNADLLEETTGVTVWHINADEPDLIDYDTSFKKDAQDAIYAPDAYRASDHDPVITGLDVCDEIAPTFDELTVSPDELWPPQHQYVDVMATVIVSDNFDPNPLVELVSVTSSEPDEGLGDGDFPDDIVIVDDFNFMLRAERSGVGGEGRTYTITYRVTDFCGNSTEQSVTVFVPFSQKGGNK